MGSMPTLHTYLRELLERHRSSEAPEVQDLLRDLDLILASAPAPVYQYRHQIRWDETWLDLNEPGVGLVLERGHTVERRIILSDWEPVTEVPA